MTKDPVCGMQIQENRAAAKATHQGKIYYFCAPACRETFTRAPEKYAAAEQGGQRKSA